MDLGFYFKLFLRRSPYFLVFLILGSAAGIAIARVLPEVYRASAVLAVESEQIPSELAASTVTTGATEALSYIRTVILARARLLEMANEFGIYEVPGSPDRQDMTADEVVTDLRRRTNFVVTGGEQRRGPTEVITVRVSFDAPDANLAATVTNELVTRILDENVALRRGQAGQTLQFFEGEVTRLDAQLAELGAEILAFQEQNLDALPDSLDFRRSQQAGLQERLVQLERAEAGLRDRRNRLVTLYEETGQVVAERDAPRTEEERQLAAARDALQAALTVFSPQNPQVRILESRVAALQAQVATQSGAGARTDEVDPQFAAYQLQLDDIDAQIDFISDEKTQIENRMAALQRTIEATPENAIRLETMQRNYEAVRARYDQAVANRARAETGDTIEANTKGQRITVIEQATRPTEPVSPNRPMIAAAGVGGGAALGLGVILLLELLNGSIRRPADIRTGLKIEPFGTLPYIRTRGQALRRRLIIMATLATVAVGVPAAVWYVDTEIMPLDLLAAKVIDRLPFADLLF